MLDSLRISLKEATGEYLKTQLSEVEEENKEYEILSTDEE